MLFTPENYAKHRDCHLDLVNLAIQQKSLVLVNGMIESTIADRIWKPGDLPQGQTRGDKSPNVEATRTLLSVKTEREAVRIERERFQLKLRELEYLQKAGKLVMKEEVEKQVFNDFRALRDAFLNIPERLAGVLAAESDEHVVYQTLRGEIERALHAFANRERAKVA